MSAPKPPVKGNQPKTLLEPTPQPVQREVPRPDVSPEVARDIRDMLRQLVNSLNAYPSMRRNAKSARLSFHVTGTPAAVQALSDLVNSQL